jgi:hypothetical protein
MDEIVWKPIPGTSQEIALDTRAHETLYCGSRGPGKTDAQLMRFRRFVGIGYGPFWRGVIFDREYKNLDDLVAKSKRWFYAFQDGARFLSSKGEYKWVWPTGEELLFRTLKGKDEYWNYHGQEFPFIGWNELTKYPDPDLYDIMMSCNRSSFLPEKDNPSLPEIPLQIFSTTNPKGPGHNWVKKRFIDPAPYGKIVWKEKEVFNPRTKEQELIKRSQVTIFGSYKENIYLSADYVAGLDSIKDENIKKAWLEGSWDVVDGGAFDDVWDSKVHIAPRFPVPAGWRVDRSFDWGSSDPFSVQWWAEANGEEVEIQGRKWAPPAGTLFLIAEWYGAKEIGLNKGLGLSATEIAQGIIEREVALMEEGWIQRQPWPGPADNQIGNTINIEDDTLEKRMSKLGVRWTKSDKSPGSRKIGFALMRDRLHNSLVAEGPGFYVMRNCQAFLEIFPTLPRDPDNLDDVDTSAEEHIWDSARYRVLKGSDRYSSNLKLKGWT